MQAEYVKNPETGRDIKVNGPTYERLKKKYKLDKAPRKTKPLPHAKYPSKPVSSQRIEEMSKMPIHKYNLEKSLETTTEPYLKKKLKTQIAKKSQGKGKRTRGWAADAPKRGTDRHKLKKECGDKCFLVPEHEGFPICPRCLGDVCTCEIDCRGLTAAKIYASKYDEYNDLLKAINELESKTACKKP